MLGKGADSLLFNDFKDQIKEYNDYQTKAQSKELLNQSSKIKSQSADYLIEYFEGMILNYISLNESKNKSLNELKNFIINNNKNNKIKGGVIDLNKYHDDNIEEIPQFNDNDWDIININVFVEYKKKYEIRIIHNHNNNLINLVIDLQHNKIINLQTKSFNNELCFSSNNIDYVLEEIIKRMIIYNYEYEYNKININFISNGKNMIDNDNTLQIIIKGIISLLIMILTLRKGVSKDVYKKYNNTFLLSGLCKHSLIKGLVIEDYKGSINKFCNNYHLLTYSSYENAIMYRGDCALNTLMCVKVPEIRELFVDKITYSQSKLTDPQFELNKLQRNIFYYYNRIINILSEMDIVGDINYKVLISNYMYIYKMFVSEITNDDYEIFKKNILSISFPDNSQKDQEKFVRLYNQYLQLTHIFRNNLLDYNNISDDNILAICDNNDALLIKVANLIRTANKTKGKYNDYTQASREFIKILDNIIKINKNNFNIFYINLLISLLLIKHKIDYIFDEDVINVLKYSDDKKKIIRCFRNMEDHCNELDAILPKYHYSYNNKKYIFMYSILKDVPHAVLSIIDINNISERKIYLYDLNNSYMCVEKINENHYINTHKYTHEYSLSNDPKRWIFNKFKENIPEYYYNNINIYFLNLNSITRWKKSSMYNCIKDSLLSNNLFIDKNKGEIDLQRLFNLNYNEYNNNNFNFNKNIKLKIFTPLINYINKLTNTNSLYGTLNNKFFIPLVNFIDNLTFNTLPFDILNNKFLLTTIYLKNLINTQIIDNEECNMKNILFRFINCLIKSNYYMNNRVLDDENLKYEYKTISEFFRNTYYIKSKKLINYLFSYDYINHNYSEFIIKIKDILDIICYKGIKKNIVYGGNLNITLIKKILIILLIVVIIIIVILIVLFIISKYKNKELKV